tara:strand:+ start:461 stop:721 length:261 start_codon:yes stop_codon:yes gene_type:complete
MPRYKFQCTKCDHIEVVFLGLDDIYEDCNNCNSKNTMQKQFDKFFSKSAQTKQHTVGNITKQYIEDNKKILEQQKKEARSEEYEPS